MVASANIYVYPTETPSSQARIYSDAGKASLISQPLVAGSDGTFQFFVEPGYYDIKIERLGYGTSWQRNVAIGIGTGRGDRVYEVLEYGADGTDTSPDEDAIQAAIDSAYSAGGGDVWLPAGTYWVGHAGAVDSVDAWCLRLKSNVTIRGDGPGTIIKLYPQLGREVQPAGYPQAHVFYSGDRRYYYPADSETYSAGDRMYEDLIDTTTVSAGSESLHPNGEVYPVNVEIRDLTIDTDYSIQPSGGDHNISPINVWYGSNIRVVNCRLTGGVAETAYFFGTHPDSNATNIVFANNLVEETGEWGVDALGVHFDRVNGVTCSNNVFQDIGLRAIGVGQCFNVAITGNQIRRVYDVGIRVVGSKWTSITGNQLFDCNQYGIEVGSEGAIESFGVNVTGNNIYVNEFNGEGGVLVKNSQRVMVGQNQINLVKYSPAYGDTASRVGGVVVMQTDSLAAGGPWARDISIVGNQIIDIDPEHSPTAIEGSPYDSLTFAPAAIQVISMAGSVTSRIPCVQVSDNYVFATYDGMRFVGVDTVWAVGNVVTGIANKDYYLVGVNESTSLETATLNLFSHNSAAATATRDTTGGSKYDINYDPPE